MLYKTFKRKVCERKCHSREKAKATQETEGERATTEKNEKWKTVKKKRGDIFIQKQNKVEV